MNTYFQIENKDKEMEPLGNGLFIKKSNDKYIELYHFDKLLKICPLKPIEEFRFFVVDLCNHHGVKKIDLHKALGISRQSIDNWQDLYHKYGMSGLIDSPKIPTGNKVRQLEEERKLYRQTIERQQLDINYAFNTGTGEKKIEVKENPYIKETGYESTRYAGIIIYIIALIAKWKWLGLIIGYYGSFYKLFLVFLLMVVRNIPSIEQLKNIRQREAGLILGINKLQSRSSVWEWFYGAVKSNLSRNMLSDFFRYQILKGIVSIWFWFIDGHLLPYSGKEKVHKSYNTQRAIPYPGQTNIVSCDLSGNIVDFEIQEGKGDLRGTILSLEDKWKSELNESPIKVFDREGDGIDFFSKAVKKGVSFVTWEKNADKLKLEKIPAEKFNTSLELNGKNYGIFEEEKHYCYTTANKDNQEEEGVHNFKLRRIYIWNKTCNRRTSGLAYDKNNRMTTIDCAFGILNRWGASENTFKHIQTRHPYNYHPGLTFTESEKQDVANPEKKEKQKELKRLKKQLDNNYKKLANSKESALKDGSPRKNSVREKIKLSITEKENQIKNLQERISQLPDRVNVSTLKDSRSFKCRDNEGKYLFDFVASSVWNARNQLIDWLSPFYQNKNEIVDLLYAISNCQGWVKITSKEVRVILEPLEQANRRAAQIQLCRKLTGLATQTPTGKFIVVEVGGKPT